MEIYFKVNNDEYTIKDISIRDYYQIKSDLVIKGRDSEFAIISQLSGCPIKTLKKIDLVSWQDLVLNLEIMIDLQFKPGKKVLTKFTHHEIEYGLCDLNKMTIGEFADLDVIVSGANADNRIHEILAILYRPIVGKKWFKPVIEEYDSDAFEYRKELFLDLPMEIAQSAAGFFLLFGKASLSRIKISSRGATKKELPMIRQAQEILTMLQGIGMGLSPDSLETILSKSKTLQDLVLEKHSTSSHTGSTSIKKSWRQRMEEWYKNIKEKHDNRSLL